MLIISIIFLLSNAVYLTYFIIIRLKRVNFDYIYIFKSLFILFICLNYIFAIYFFSEDFNFIPLITWPFIIICNIIYLVAVFKSINVNKLDILKYLKKKIYKKELIFFILIITFYSFLLNHLSVYAVFYCLINTWFLHLISKMLINFLEIYIIKKKILNVDRYKFFKITAESITWDDFIFITVRVLLICIFKSIILYIKIIYFNL